MNNPIIELKDLTKCYGPKKAVDNLQLKIFTGEIFGLLGPNGAGKTTSILMMLGLTEPTSGTANVCGYNATRNPIEVKKHVGYLPDNVGFYPDKTAKENLIFIAELNGFSKNLAEEKAKELLALVGLSHASNQKAGTFSRGMKQRLGLAEVLIKEPKVVILDEPTLGIDPRGVDEFLELIKELSRVKQLTVLLSSHHLQQVQRICDRVGIFVNGKMIIEGPIEELANTLQAKQGFQTEIELGSVANDASAYQILFSKIPDFKSVEVNENKIIVHASNDITPHLVRTLIYDNAEVLAVNRNRYSLDDIYNTYFDESTQQIEKEVLTHG